MCVSAVVQLCVLGWVERHGGGHGVCSAAWLLGSSALHTHGEVGLFFRGWLHRAVRNFSRSVSPQLLSRSRSFLEESGSEWNHHVDFLLHPEMWDLSEDRTDDVSWCVRCNFWAHSSLFPLPSHKGKPQKKSGTTPPDVPVVRDVFIFQVIKNSSGSGQQRVKERNGFICLPL